MNHRLGETDALEHALGVAADAAVTGIPKSDQVKKLLHPFLQCPATQAAESSVEGDCLGSCEKFVEVGILGKESYIGAAGDLVAWQAEDL